jgi:DNA (cytosine-5)-methyltransferase 1
MTIKILNLYAGIGGNRKLWSGDIEVTAIENNPEIAKIYQDFFPNDKVIITDAHQYLLEHYKEFDFIWSSPPCPSHSKIRNEAGVGSGKVEAIYPDMNLYQEIIFLKHYFKGKWVVENVIPYYEVLIPGKIIQRHIFWSNYNLSKIDIPTDSINLGKMKDFRKNGDIRKYKLDNERQVLRNCVNSQLGLHIFEMAFKRPQLTLFVEEKQDDTL